MRNGGGGEGNEPYIDDIEYTAGKDIRNYTREYSKSAKINIWQGDSMMIAKWMKTTEVNRMIINNEPFDEIYFVYRENAQPARINYVDVDGHVQWFRGILYRYISLSITVDNDK